MRMACPEEKETTSSPLSPFAAMQAAVDIVNTSPHPANKIAATVFDSAYSFSCTNHWPPAIEATIGQGVEIGNSSGTIHAETAAIFKSWQNGRKTAGASLCITDPFCPNCAKNIAEAGIKTIYIDHKGFKKDFFARRADQFEAMSMQICEKAGISVYELWRADQKLVPIYMAPKDYIPAEDSPLTTDEINTADEKTFQFYIAQAHSIHARRKFALSFARAQDGMLLSLTARAHAVIGYTMADPQDALCIECPEDKYSFIQEPVNRMLMAAARHGYRLEEGYFYCSQVPTSREQVNLVGAGIRRITIGDMKRSRDKNGLHAMQQLKTAKVIDYS